MEASVEKKQRFHMCALVGTINASAILAHHARLWTCLNSLRQDNFWKGIEIWFFSLGLAALVFFSSSSLSSQVITPCDDGIPMDQKSYLDESYIKSSLQRRWEEDKPITVKEVWMRIPQTPSSLLVTSIFPITNWIGWAIFLNELNDSSTQWLPSLLARTVSFREATYVFLEIMGYKSRTEYPEGDSDSEQQEEVEWNLSDAKEYGSHKFP